MPAGLDSYGARDYPPPCRHTKALTDKDLKIKSLETEVRRLMEHKKQADAEAKHLQFLREEEAIKREHCEVVIASQRQAINELEELLRTQQTVVDSIFGDGDDTDGAATRLGAMADRMQGALYQAGLRTAPPPGQQPQPQRVQQQGVGVGRVQPGRRHGAFDEESMENDDDGIGSQISRLSAPDADGEVGATGDTFM